MPTTPLHPSPAARFTAGATYHLRAASLLAQAPELWRFVWAPMLVSALAAVVLYAGALSAGWRAIGQLVQRLPAWAVWAEPLLRVGLVVGLLLLIGVVIAKFGVVLGAPWYGQLSEAIEERALGTDMPAAPRGAAAMARDIGRALGYEIKKLGLTLGIGLPLLLLNLVPVIGSVVATVGGAALAATIANMDFGDPPLERRGYRFRQKLATVWADVPRSAGFGLVAMVLVGIPLVNLLTVPLSMVAGALMFLDRHAAGTLPAADR